MRFVVLHHVVTEEYSRKSGRKTHFDLMLEYGDSLKTWAIESWPLPLNIPQRSTRLSEHRLEYLEYEGPLSDGRGHVARVAQGTFETVEQATDQLLVRLSEKSTAIRLEITPDTITSWSDDLS